MHLTVTLARRITRFTWTERESELANLSSYTLFILCVSSSFFLLFFFPSLSHSLLFSYIICFYTFSSSFTTIICLVHLILECLVWRCINFLAVSLYFQLYYPYFSLNFCILISCWRSFAWIWPLVFKYDLMFSTYYPASHLYIVIRGFCVEFVFFAFNFIYLFIYSSYVQYRFYEMDCLMCLNVRISY